MTKSGELVHLEKDQTNDTWLAASTSLGLLGIIARVKFAVVADFKVYANQTMLVIKGLVAAIDACSLVSMKMMFWMVTSMLRFRRMSPPITGFVIPYLPLLHYN